MKKKSEVISEEVKVTSVIDKKLSEPKEFDEPKITTDSEPPNYTLIVKSPFRHHLTKGEHITDPEEIKKIMSCHEQSMVIKRSLTR